jgi:hypothetical protein
MVRAHCAVVATHSSVAAFLRPKGSLRQSPHRRSALPPPTPIPPKQETRHVYHPADGRADQAVFPRPKATIRSTSFSYYSSSNTALKRGSFKKSKMFCGGIGYGGKTASMVASRGLWSGGKYRQRRERTGGQSCRRSVIPPRPRQAAPPVGWPEAIISTGSVGQPTRPENAWVQQVHQHAANSQQSFPE